MIKTAIPPYHTCNWVPHPAVAERLESLQNEKGEPLRISAEMVRLDSLKVQKSLNNNARINEPLNDQHVLLIAQSMEAGEAINYIVTTNVGDILAGNHRTAAAEFCGYDSVGAYVVSNADKKTQDLIVRTDNASHGMAYSKEEKIRHALYLISMGFTVEEVAVLESIDYDELLKRKESQEIRYKLDEMGVDVSGVHHSTLYELRRIENSQILQDTAKIVTGTHLSAAQTKKVVSRINNSNNKKATLEEIKKEGIGPSSKKKHNLVKKHFFHKLNSKTSLLYYLEHGNNGGQFTDPQQLQLYDEKELKEARKEARKLIKLMKNALNI